MTPGKNTVTCSTPQTATSEIASWSRGKSRRPTTAPGASCWITTGAPCAFCGKGKHYEDECYHKQRLSAKRKGEDPGEGSGKGGGKGYGNESGKGGGKGHGNDSGKGKWKDCGKGRDKSQGGRGGGASRQPDKDNRNQDKNGGNPNPKPGGNSEPS